MKCKEYLKKFIPPICCQVYNCLIRKSLKQPEIYPLPIPEGAYDKLVIIGNGPSLNITMEKYEKEVRSSECLMVNEAALTSLYDLIKPSIYMLVDPKFYLSEGYESYQETLNSLVNVIVSKTDWTMKIIMPRNAIGSYVVQRFKENTNIDIMFYENGWYSPKLTSKFEKWDNNFVAPPAQTVLNTAVWLAIYWGYKETYIVGADTSWHVGLKMDQQTNELYTIDTHFFNNKEIYGDLYDDKHERRPIHKKMHEELFAEATALNGYWDLREYAEWKGVNVYNASEYSWIDAFERKKI